MTEVKGKEMANNSECNPLRIEARTETRVDDGGRGEKTETTRTKCHALSPGILSRRAGPILVIYYYFFEIPC